MANRDSFDDFENDDQDDGFLTFDARDEEEDKSRGPLVIAAIVAVLLICGIILWQLYAGSRDAGETPQIASDTGAFKTAPAETGGAIIADTEKGVFDAAEGTGAPPLDVQPASGAEDPLLADGGAVPTPVARPAAASTNVPTPTPAPRREAAVATTPSPKQVVAPAPKPVAKPAAVKVAEATPAPRPVPSPAPRVAVATPAVKAPAPVRVSVPVRVPAPVQIAAVPSTAPKAAAVPARPSAGGIAAQLGSFQTRAAAEVALARYRTSGLSGPVAVVAADLGAKGTWYRIRATGFDTRAEVDGFCAKARSAGAQCIPSGR